MKHLEPILKVGLYILVCAALYLVGGINLGNEVAVGENVAKQGKRKIGMLTILALSSLVGWYATICSQQPLSSDRGNYAMRFVNNWQAPWTTGLNALADFLHMFTNDADALFFMVSFLCVALTLIAYRLNENASRESLLLYVCGGLIMDSFCLLKQAPAVAFGTISIVLLLRRKYPSSLFMLALAISFHESALILIPVYAMLLSSGSKTMRYASLAIMILTLLAFSGVSRVVFEFIERWLPDLTEEVGAYRAEGGAMKHSQNLFTAIKGLPYYLILFRGMKMRGVLRLQIAHYDKYLILAGFASLTSLLSAYMYWMFRFGLYCYVPLCFFAAELYKKDGNRRSASVFWWFLVSSTLFFNVRYLLQIFLLYGGF